MFHVMQNIYNKIKSNFSNGNEASDAPLKRSIQEEQQSGQPLAMHYHQILDNLTSVTSFITKIEHVTLSSISPNIFSYSETAFVVLFHVMYYITSDSQSLKFLLKYINIRVFY